MNQLIQIAEKDNFAKFVKWKVNSKFILTRDYKKYNLFSYVII